MNYLQIITGFRKKIKFYITAKHNKQSFEIKTGLEIFFICHPVGIFHYTLSIF